MQEKCVITILLRRSAQLESSVLEDQAVDWLLGRVKVVDQPSTFKELMKFGADAPGASA